MIRMNECHIYVQHDSTFTELFHRVEEIGGGGHTKWYKVGIREQLNHCITGQKQLET